MKTTDFTVRVIEPSDGKWLTNSGDVPLRDRVFSRKVFLAANDSPDNWAEITDGEYQEHQRRIAETEKDILDNTK